MLRATAAVTIVLALAAYGARTEAGADLLLATIKGRWHDEPRLAVEGERAIILLTGDHLWRVPAAAALQRETGLPLVVSGRNSGYYFKVLRAAGADKLWPELDSINTEQNAAYSTCLANRHGMKSVFIVTDEAHMPRAVAWFRYYGMHVTPVVSGPPWPGHSANALLPSKIGWSRSKAVIHEWAGLIDFGLRALVHHRLPCPKPADPGEA